MLNLMPVYQIGNNLYTIYTEDAPILWEHFNGTDVRSRSETVARCVSLTSRTVIIGLNVYTIIVNRRLNQKDLLPEVRKKYQAILSKIEWNDLKIKTVGLVNLCFLRKAEGKDIVDQKIAIEAGELGITYLKLNKVASAGLLVSEAALKCYSIYQNRFDLNRNLNTFYDCSLTWYDYWFPNPTLQLDMVQLNLENVRARELTYDDIPKNCSHNAVFRKFKCTLSNKTIRFPVVVLDQNDDPLKPICLYERKELINRMSHERLVYPNTTVVIKLSYVREHLGIRNIIANEIRSLGLTLN